MLVVQRDTGVHIELDRAEQELLALALCRATFEDTPPDRQQEILDLALALRRALGETV